MYIGECVSIITMSFFIIWHQAQASDHSFKYTKRKILNISIYLLFLLNHLLETFLKGNFLVKDLKFNKRCFCVASDCGRKLFSPGSNFKKIRPSKIRCHWYLTFPLGEFCVSISLWVLTYFFDNFGSPKRLELILYKLATPESLHRKTRSCLIHCLR